MPYSELQVKAKLLHIGLLKGKGICLKKKIKSYTNHCLFALSDVYRDHRGASEVTAIIMDFRRNKSLRGLVHAQHTTFGIKGLGIHQRYES